MAKRYNGNDEFQTNDLQIFVNGFGKPNGDSFFLGFMWIIEMQNGGANFDFQFTISAGPCNEQPKNYTTRCAYKVCLLYSIFKNNTLVQGVQKNAIFFAYKSGIKKT